MSRKWQWLIVGGCPRSGTTVLNFVFNDHPRIRLTNENNLGALTNHLKALFHREQVIARVPDRARGMNESWHREDVRMATLRSSRSLLPMLRTLYEANFSDQVNIDEIQYLGDKLPTYYLEDFSEVRDLLYPLTVIHISRNPLTVINSMMRRSENSAMGKDTWKGPASITDACVEWVKAWNFVTGLQNRADSSGVKLLHLKFEDLVTEPEQTFANIQRFLQIEEPFDISRVLANTEFPLEMLSEQARQEVNRLLPGVVDSWNLPLAELCSTIGLLSVSRNTAPERTHLIERSRSMRTGGQILQRFTQGVLRKAGYELKRYVPRMEAVGSGLPAKRGTSSTASRSGECVIGKRIAGRDEILDYFIREYRFHTVLDIGCGTGGTLNTLAASGRLVTGVDILPCTEVILPLDSTSVSYIQHDFWDFNIDEKFDAVVSSHFIEHMADTERFLTKYFSFLKEDGVFCLIWPPLKHTIVGGHVHAFNMGLMLYNLVRLGIDCRGVDMLRCDYSQAIVGRLRRFEIPLLKNDEGDIETLAPYLPFPARQDFDGDTVPGVIDIPGYQA